MNGRDFEATTLMTHYESDYGAATKVHYPKGQTVTCIVPNLHCTKWFAFRGRIVDSPSFDMCRSQMDVEIAGDWRALTKELEGFHTTNQMTLHPSRRRASVLQTPLCPPWPSRRLQDRRPTADVRTR